MKKKDYIVPQIAVEELQTEGMLAQSPDGEPRIIHGGDGLGYHDVLVKKEVSIPNVWDEEW